MSGVLRYLRLRGVGRFRLEMRERETGERTGKGREGWRGLQGAADSRSARGAAI